MLLGTSPRAAADVGSPTLLTSLVCPARGICTKRAGDPRQPPLHRGAPALPCPPRPGDNNNCKYYIIQSGDTLESIALSLDLLRLDLEKINPQASTLQVNRRAAPLKPAGCWGAGAVVGMGCWV